MPAVSAVYVSQQLAPLLLGDASQRDIIWPSSVEFTILNAVRDGLPDHVLCIFFLLRQGPLE
jgi:hypothetical protein